MFIKNKYYRWYYQIIDAARQRGKPNDYYEKHHVIPKCMGGKNDFWNTANLTYREHYIVHWLLIKFTEGKILRQMQNALGQMANKTNNHARNVPARWYERSRRALAESNLRPRLGAKLSEETKQKISATQKANGHRKGVKFTEEHKLGISRGNKGKIRTEETKRQISDTLIMKSKNGKIKKRKSKIFVDYLGNSMLITQAVYAAGNIVSADCALARIKLGWPHREAVEMPVGSKKSQWPSLQLG